MTKFYPTIKAVLVTSFILALATVAQAQATRTWVSGVGDDLNPCSRTAPCKTFAGAISKTAKDGEISVLDPGGYGAVTITKSIYINGTHGAGYGSIIASLVNGIVINITDAADVRKAVRLRAQDPALIRQAELGEPPLEEIPRGDAAVSLAALRFGLIGAKKDVAPRHGDANRLGDRSLRVRHRYGRGDQLLDYMRPHGLSPLPGPVKLP